jgi:hypothetical protein
MVRLITYIVLLYLFESQGFVYAETKDIKQLSKLTNKWSNLESTIKGEHLKVILAAYEYFSKKVNPNAAKVEENSDPNSFRAYLTKLENYDIQVYKGDNKFVVMFVLRKNEKHIGFMGDGGISMYEVDPKTYQVAEFTIGK